MIIEITNFKQLLNLKPSQKDVIIFHTFVWSCCQLQFHDVLLQRGRKNNAEGIERMEGSYFILKLPC